MARVGNRMARPPAASIRSHKLCACWAGRVTNTPAPRRKRAPLLPTDLKERLRETEIDLLTAALEKARFNQRLAADLLGLSYHQFRGKLRKFEIRSKPGQA